MKTLYVVNPYSRNGRAADAGHWIHDRIRERGEEADCDLFFTKREGHAAEIACRAGAYDRVVAVGGDGVVNELVNGLMRLDADARPELAVIPFGNGNDFARTNRMPLNSLKAAWEALGSARAIPYDVGEVNGTYFVETLSFGLDAAIANGTHELREKTGRSGTLLFVDEGIRQLVHGRKVYHMKLDVAPKREGGDGDVAAGHLASATVAGASAGSAAASGESASAGSAADVARGRGIAATGAHTYEGDVHLFACQVGPTYGGGFAITPDADPTDGEFSLCIARAPLGLLHGLRVFAVAKGGGHVTNTRDFTFLKAPAFTVDFGEEVPAQADGERVTGSKFAVSTHPHALRVLSLR